MKLSNSLIIGMAALFACSGRASAQENATIRQLSWLSGCWEARSPMHVIEEQWMEPRGNGMLGMNRTVRNDSLVGYELVIIRESGDGLVFEAHPSGQPTAFFPSLVLSDTLIVFENPEHDFPQRIGYGRRGTDSLIAWIEGSSDGATRTVDFAYERASCPGR